MYDNFINAGRMWVAAKGIFYSVDFDENEMILALRR